MATTAKPAPSWRDTLPIHSAAKLFPEMSPDEQKVVGADIRKHGLTSPIALWQADPKGQAQLLDGRNRLDRIELVTGCPVEIGPPSLAAGKFLAINKVIVLDARTDPYAYVISANLARRHLSADDKRKVIANLILAQPDKSDRQIADMIRVSHHTVASVRAEMEGRGQIAHAETRTDSTGRQQPARKRRKVKFTPESIAQIKNLVERGKTRDEIAKIIGVTVGALRVTCSRLGISLPTATPPQTKGTRDDVGADSRDEIEEAKAPRAGDGQPADDDAPSEWKPKCLAHLPVATRLEMLVALLEDGLTPTKKLVEALRLPANASVKRQAQLDGLQGMVGAIFDWMNIVKDEVEEIRRVLLAYEQRDNNPEQQIDTDETDAPAEAADLVPPADDGLDIPPYLRRAP
jgi:transposase